MDTNTISDSSRLALLEEVSRLELCKMIDILNHAKIQFLIIKGSAFAYSHYTKPWDRPRLDSDLWISPLQIEQASTLLKDSGFTLLPTNHGTLVHTQMIFYSTDRRGHKHYFDLHWGLLNPVFFRSLLSFSEAWNESQFLPQLHPNARTLSDRHHFLHACCHWVGHHFIDPSPKWEKDIELLCAGKSSDWWIETQNLLIHKKVAAIAVAILNTVSEKHSLKIPVEVLIRLNAISGEVSNYFLQSDRNRWRDFVFDMKCLPNHQMRLRLLQEHLFPSSDYIYAVAGSKSKFEIFYFYLARILKGFKKLSSVSRP